MATVPVPYMSFSLFYDSKIKLKSNGDYIGAGIGFDYDRAGDSELSLSSLNIGLNYGLTLSKGHLIILGLSPNIGQRRLSDEKLKWEVNGLVTIMIKIDPQMKILIQLGICF